MGLGSFGNWGMKLASFGGGSWRARENAEHAKGGVGQRGVGQDWVRSAEEDGVLARPKQPDQAIRRSSAG